MLIATALGVVAAVVGVLLGLRAVGLLGVATEAPKRNVLPASGGVAPGLLAKTGAPGGAVLPKVGELPPSMPPELYAWLKHLEKVEAMKIELSLRQQAEMMKFQQMLSVLGAGMGMLNPYESDDKSPDQITTGKFQDLKPEWERLIAFFNSVPPPPEAQPLAADYNRALGEIPGMTSDVVEILNSVTSDPTGALQRIGSLKAKSYGDIDRYFLRADERLSGITAKYGVPKWFNIKADASVGGSMGKLGF